MAIKALLGYTPDGQLYFDEEMNYVGAMLPPGPWKTAHGPGLVETPAGTLLCCWFAGTYEGDTDVNIVVSRLEKGSDQWSEPAYISCDNDFSNQNPSLFVAPTGQIWCLYTSQRGREDGKDNMQFTSVIKRQVSVDDGLTWSEPELVLSDEGTFARQAIQVLSNGRWIYGLWLCRDSETGLAGDPSTFAISDDKGATWRRVDMPRSAGRVHPSIVELKSGHLLAFMRSREADFIYRSESFDFGDSWSAPVATPLPNNNSGIAAVKLASGRVALAYNHNSAPATYGVKGAWPALRNPVAIALSEDGGKTFPLIRFVERGEGYVGSENRFSNRQYEYPCLMQASDGMLHIAYAYQTRRGVKWVKLSEEDVIGTVRGEGVYNPTSGEVSR
ncbi:exo-alpha-sialidase [Collinsella sp. zg1085]|uniref:sialidase family protein n=1 Tax=Collinsella sp. zg1085 TaxID=2844380 RepID=UPI001C0BD39C|nr:sialidase family protein [Collinsella sp. zg1085]QWT17473.1 exo-alpha-sialidase [Collinsella sp. zg1085]